MNTETFRAYLPRWLRHVAHRLFGYERALCIECLHSQIDTDR